MSENIYTICQLHFDRASIPREIFQDFNVLCGGGPIVSEIF